MNLRFGVVFLCRESTHFMKVLTCHVLSNLKNEINNNETTDLALRLSFTNLVVSDNEVSGEIAISGLVAEIVSNADTELRVLSQV